MKRRDFLKTTVTAATAGSALLAFPGLAKANANYTGKLLVTVYAHGGWDPTSFCDPKMNAEGKPVINNWAKNQSTKKIGNISYAPFAENDRFFKAHYKKMLVINGINTKTNGHFTGELNNLTGSMSEGHPSLAALAAAVNKDETFMPWMHNGFRPQNGKLIAPSYLANKNAVNKVKDIIQPDLYRYGSTSRHMNLEDVNAIRQFQQDKNQRNSSDSSYLLKKRNQYARYYDATYKNSGVNEFVSIYDTADTKGLDRNNGHYSQAIAAIAALKSGISLTADLRVSNFDTHRNHDVNHAARLTQLTNTVDLLWYLAENYGIADRLVVHIASDIGRTNKYNSNGGKDHWSITSGIIMANDPNWGNRVVGSTDEVHKAHKMNFNTLQRDDANGDYIEPKHVMASLRDLMGVESSLEARRFSLDISAKVDMFNSRYMTV